MKIIKFEYDLVCQSHCLICEGQFKENETIIEDDNERFHQDCFQELNDNEN